MGQALTADSGRKVLHSIFDPVKDKEEVRKKDIETEKLSEKLLVKSSEATTLVQNQTLVGNPDRLPSKVSKTKPCRETDSLFVCLRRNPLLSSVVQLDECGIRKR